MSEMIRFSGGGKSVPADWTTTNKATIVWDLDDKSARNVTTIGLEYGPDSNANLGFYFLPRTQTGLGDELSELMLNISGGAGRSQWTFPRPAPGPHRYTFVIDRSNTTDPFKVWVDGARQTLTRRNTGSYSGTPDGTNFTGSGLYYMARNFTANTVTGLASVPKQFTYAFSDADAALASTTLTAPIQGGLVAHLNPEALDLPDGTTVTSAPAVGGTTAWTVQGTGPIFRTRGVNNRPYLQQTSAGTGLRWAQSLAAGDSTVFVVARMRGTANQRILSGLSNNWLLGWWASGATGRQDQHYGEGWVYSPTDDATPTLRGYCARRSSGTTTFRRAGQAAATLAQNTAGTQGPNGLTTNGHLGASEFSDADVYEVIAYNRALSDAEIALTDDYLESRYGVRQTSLVKPPVAPVFAEPRLIKRTTSEDVSHYSDRIAAAKPASNWRLDETSGTVAKDSVGSTSGTHVGAVQPGTAPGLLGGKSATYPDASAYTRVPVRVGPRGSVALLVKTDSWGDTNTHGLFQSQDAASVNYAGWMSLFRYQGNPGPFYYRIVNDAGTLIDIATTWTSWFTTSGWNHVVATWGDGRTDLYVNGVLVGSRTDLGTYSGDTTVEAASSRIGYGHLAGGNGTPIDDVSVFTRPLSASEVATLYRQAAAQVGVSESISSSALLRRTGSDTASASDSATRAPTFKRSTADSTTVTDAASRAPVFKRSGSDAAAATDAATRSPVFKRSGADSTPGTETASSPAIHPRSGSDTISGVSDQSTGEAMQARLVGDNAPAVDDGTRLPAIRARESAELLPLTDAASRQGVFQRGTGDSGTTGDGGVRQGIFRRSPGDSAPASEGLVSRAFLARTSADAVATTDAATRALAFNRSATDAAPTTDDSGTRLIFFSRQGTDATPGEDQVAHLVTRFAEAQDGTSVSDGIERVVLTDRSGDDEAGSGDYLDRAQILGRQVGDAASAADSPDSRAILSRRGADLAPGRDAVAQRFIRVRQWGESAVLLGDAASRRLALPRRSADLLPSTADAATSTSLHLRKTGEALRPTRDWTIRTLLASRAPEEVLATAETVWTLRRSIRLLTEVSVLSESVVAEVRFNPRLSPEVRITSVSRSKVSRVGGFDASTVTFIFDQPVQAWSVRLNSTDHLDGTSVADWRGEPTLYGLAIVPADLLRLGGNRITVYAQGVTGWWSR